MITIAFKRFGDGIFIPHVDVLRNLNRTFRRSEIDVGYSKGFVKHMKLKLTQPLPFGIADDDGYVTADVEVEDIVSAINAFNENCPPFLRATAIYRTEKNPNLAGLVDTAEYFAAALLTDEQMDRINNLPADYVVRQKKGEEVTEKSTAGLIKFLHAEKNGVVAKLAFGNVNLRIDLLINAFNEDFGTSFVLTDVVRTKQYLNGGNLSASDYLKENCSEWYFSE